MHHAAGDYEHLPGWDEWYKEITRRFAYHGYAAICPDLYCREGHGPAADLAARVRAAGGVPAEPGIRGAARANAPPSTEARLTVILRGDETSVRGASPS
jgi:carboxymethylenebutenolidase